MLATSVTRSYTWAMGHRLKDHKGLCRFPHGHTYQADVTIGGPLVAQSGASDRDMILDFKALDTVVLAELAKWDHAFMVEDTDPFLALLLQAKDDPGIGAAVVVVPFAPTAERIAGRLRQQVQESPWLREGLVVERVSVHEGPRSIATVSRDVG